MVSDNSSQFGTAFTVSIEAKQGVTTGVSAADRVTTIKTACQPGARPVDLARPGHVFPLRAKQGGVLTRRGHTEGTIDLMQMAGLSPFGVLCEVTNPDGTISLVITDGATSGVEFIVGELEGKTTLNLITPQHKYVLTESD